MRATWWSRRSSPAAPPCWRARRSQAPSTLLLLPARVARAPPAGLRPGASGDAGPEAAGARGAQAGPAGQPGRAEGGALAGGRGVAVLRGCGPRRASRLRPVCKSLVVGMHEHFCSGRVRAQGTSRSSWGRARRRAGTAARLSGAPPRPSRRPCDGTRPRRRPALETPPDILLETLYQSLAFFYVNPIMSSLGLSFIPDVPARPARPRVIAARGRQLRRPRAQVHPVGLGVFNFVNAWCAPGAVLGASPMAWAPRAEACGGAQVADAAAADDGRPQGPGRAAEVPALRGHAGAAQSAAAAMLRMRAPAADAPRARSS